MALFCRKRSSRETERRRRVHKLNFKFSCWITIVSHASPHYWMGNKKKASTFQGNNFKKKKKHFKSHLFFYIHALYWHKHNSLCAIFIIFFPFPLGEKKRWVSEWIYRKRLQWADISFSRSCHEGTCEMGEASPPPPPPWWTGVENVVCGWCVDVSEHFGFPAVALGNINVI